MKGLFSLGALFVVFIVSAAYLGVHVLGLSPTGGDIHLRMSLEDTGGVATGSPVLMSGVRVGEVEVIERGPAGVEVTLKIEESAGVPVESRVRIENLSGLGEPYIDFRPTGGDGSVLRDGDHVAAQRVDLPTTIPELAARAVDLLDQLDPATLESLVDTAETAVEATEDVIPQLARANKLLAATILSRSDRLRELLVNLQEIGADMAWAESSIRGSGRELARFGGAADDLIAVAKDLYETGDWPEDYTTDGGAAVFAADLNDYVSKVGPSDLENVAAIAPVLAASARAIPAVDISALLAQALDFVRADGNFHLKIIATEPE